MNLHSLVSPYVGAVNPPVLVSIRQSTGPSARAPDGTAIPTFATPGAFTGALAAGVLTVSALTGGFLSPGQTISGAGVGPNTSIAAQLTGTDGGIGTYSVNGSQGLTIGAEPMTTALVMPAQVQALSGHDLRQIEGLNLQGTLRAIYVSGSLQGVVRPLMLGGDLVILPDGTVWLVTVVGEPWMTSAFWTKAILTLQNGA